MDARTTTTLRCTSCGALTEAKCACGAPYQYISPGELAAKAVRANPEKSDRVIATEIGVSHPTVIRARKRTGTNVPVEKRTGRDGKARRMPKRQSKPLGVKQAQRSIDLLPEVWAQVKARAVAAGVPAAEFIGQLLTNKIDPEIDPKMFSKSASEKLTAAIRQHQKKLDREYDDRRAKEIMAHIDRIMPTLQAEKNKASEREQTYREFMQKQKKIMTLKEFNELLSVIHPDSRGSVSEDRLMRIFQMLRPKKFALTGEK